MTTRARKPSWLTAMPLSGLDELEANEAIRKLKRGEVTSDNIPPTAQSGWPPTKDGI